MFLLFAMALAAATAAYAASHLEISQQPSRRFDRFM